MRAQANSSLGVPFVLLFFILSNYIILNLFIGAILANMGSMTEAKCIEMTQQMREDELRMQRQAREAHLFVKGCAAAADANNARGQDLTTLQQVTKHALFRETFMSSPVIHERFGLQVSNNALGVFSPYTSFRKFVYKTVKNPYFDFFILIVIVYSTVLLTMVNKDTSSDEGWKNFFQVNDIIFVTIFTIEFGLKLIAFGFIWCDNVELMLMSEEELKELMMGSHGSPSYMCDAWNYLDLIVLFVSYVNLLGDPEGPLKVLRLLRAFRPLRMVNRIEGMKVIIKALFRAGPSLGNVCVILFSIFLIFGILGLNLFMGKFESCNDVVSSYVGGSNKNHCFGFNTQSDYWSPKVTSCFVCTMTSHIYSLS